jgi:hypothetical protein
MNNCFRWDYAGTAITVIGNNPINPSSRQFALPFYHSLSTLLAPMHHNTYQCKEN